jgi:AcrR family transcriptional regulator
MNKITKIRKQREFDGRSELILEIARRHLMEQGYIGLNMDRIAQEAEYSKGTIYQHFLNKEDLLMGLAVQTLEKRHELFQRASQFSGRDRMRLQAIGVADVIFVNLYPEHFRVEQLLRTSSIRDKTDPERQQALHACEQNCMKLISGIVIAAIEHGDLKLPPERSPQDMTFGLWSMALGSNLILASGTMVQALGVTNPGEAINHNFYMLLDGYGWTPLTRDACPRASQQEIIETVFAEEWAEVQRLFQLRSQAESSPT